MTERRRTVDAAIKTLTVPLLRQRGFKGSYPHFYRAVGEHVDLLMFQFRQDGSSFIVEVSYADPARKNVSFRPETPVQNLQVPATRSRYRLGSQNKVDADGEWLSIAPGLLASEANHIKRLALRVNELLLEEGEPWWESKRHGI